MRKLFFAFLLTACATPVFACDIRPAKGLLFDPIGFAPVSYTLMGYRSLCASPMCSAPRFSVMRTNRFVLNTRTGTYAAIPFHTGAVFCRMENYTLRNYSIKFSIHAGGYRE